MFLFRNQTRPTTRGTQKVDTEQRIQFFVATVNIHWPTATTGVVGAREESVYNSSYRLVLDYPPNLCRRSLDRLTPMASKRSKKSASTSGGTATENPPESPRSATDTLADSPPSSTTSTPPAAWKTGEQLEFMLSKWSLYLTHQNEGTLDRFWPPVFDHWQRTWVVEPPAKAVKKHGGRENAILVIRSETQVVSVTNSHCSPHDHSLVAHQRIRAWFHNAARAGAKLPTISGPKPDLRLDQLQKRMLATAQAYCTYAWDSGLREIVIARWEKEKRLHMSADEDDPTPGSTSPGSHIPIKFKMKVTKEVFNGLDAEQKKQVHIRRENDRKKLYRTIPEIEDAEERNQKLLTHHR